MEGSTRRRTTLSVWILGLPRPLISNLFTFIRDTDNVVRLDFESATSLVFNFLPSSGDTDNVVRLGFESPTSPDF
jgi:hypothetical protein